MKNNRTTALLMLLVFLLVAAVVIIFLTGDKAPKKDGPIENVTIPGDTSVSAETPAPTPDPTTVPTVAPTYYAPSTSAPSQTARPVQTAAPPQATPTPTPTPSSDVGMLPAEELIPATPDTGTEPDGTPTVTVPVGTTLGSGTFRSDTGTPLNIYAEWSASVSGAQTADVTVTVYVDSYSLYTTASPEALNIAVDTQYVSLASPAIEYDGTDGQRVTMINSRTFSVNLGPGESRSIPVQIVWNYRGTYGEVYMDTIECGGSISLSR